MTQRKLHLLFPTPVMVTELDIDVVEKCSELVINNLTEEKHQSLNRLGICSVYDNLNLLPEFKQLYNIINDEVLKFFDGYLGIDASDTYMSSMWSNVITNQGFHSIHNHPNSFYSGVVYLNVPPATAGDFFFSDPRQSKSMVMLDYKKHNALSDRTWWFKQKTGMMILFPSWLEHGVDRCLIEKNEYRVSLSFNYVIDKCNLSTTQIGRWE
jgi:uncharacterized protein (TIGR02466 family)